MGSKAPSQTHFRLSTAWVSSLQQNGWTISKSKKLRRVDSSASHGSFGSFPWKILSSDYAHCFVISLHWVALRCYRWTLKRMSDTLWVLRKLQRVARPKQAVPDCAVLPMPLWRLAGHVFVFAGFGDPWPRCTGEHEHDDCVFACTQVPTRWSQVPMPIGQLFKTPSPRKTAIASTRTKSWG